MESLASWVKYESTKSLPTSNPSALSVAATHVRQSGGAAVVPYTACGPQFMQTRKGEGGGVEALVWCHVHTGRQAGRQTERQRDRETERQKERNGERERDGDRENVCTLAYLHLHSFPRLGPVRVFVVSRQGEMMMSGQSQF